MQQKMFKTRRIALTAILLLSTISIISMSKMTPVTKAASSNDETKPMEFYFHYTDNPVNVAGLQTKYVMNTTRWFKFLNQQEAYANSFYKEEGLPKIVIAFYLYPNFAGSATINGTWQVFVWVNSSAYQPAEFDLEFKEITIGGVTLWDSGLLSPTVTSTIGEYVDVPVYNYNLSVSLAHSFNVDTTLLVEITINTGASADARIWYDSPLYPSKVILPVKDYARPASIKTYAVDNSETDLFYYNWSESQRKVIVRANVTDPFGGYDIYKVNITILDPTGQPVVDNADMTRVSDGQWRINYAHLFEANWSYPTTAALGNYLVTISVIDNNGYYQNIDMGTFEPFIEEGTHIFTIGVIVYYDPAFIVTDDANNPLPNAQVYITWTNGTTDTLPRYTANDGFINLTQVSAGNYGFTILWKDVVVQQTTVYVDSNGPYTIKTRVYQLTVEVLGNNRVPIQGAYVIVYTESGVGYGLDTTDAAGQALFKLPTGAYRIDVHYSSDYWLTVVRTSATEPVSVAASTSKTIILDDFPPALWTTLGFWVLIVSLVVPVLVVVLFVLYKKGKILGRGLHCPLFHFA